MRWEGDTRGQGITSAAAAATDAQRLVHAMAQPDWVAEEPESHLLPHLREALTSEPLRLSSAETLPDGSFAVALGCSDEPSNRRAIRAAVYRLIGALAELSTHVHEQVLPDGGVEFVVTTGILDGDTQWQGHGHVVRLRISSPSGQS